MTRCAVIMAGGSGTRLWPLSRRDRPKQLLRIIEGKSLLRHSYERLSAIFDPKLIHVVALARHHAVVAAELPELANENIIGEPVGRDTAAAIALSAAILEHRHGPCTMGVFTADHVIRPVERFVECVQRGLALAEQSVDALIAFGVRPISSETGYGYLQLGDSPSPGARTVVAFKEKPDLAMATSYVASGQYAWNSGMFAWRTTSILERLRADLQTTHAAATRLAAIWGTPAGDRLAAELYQALPKISIDFAVMERAPRVLAVEMDLTWLDVGSWPALTAALEADRRGNIVAGAAHFDIDGGRNIIVAEDGHVIATIGIDDLIVVHSSEATLVCRRKEAQRIKELVDKLPDDLK